MEQHELALKIEQILSDLDKSEFQSFIEKDISVPDPFRGEGEIKIIVLGQDPTIQNMKFRRSVKVTLLLNQPGKLREYIGRICEGIGIIVDENVYATNLLKNFFLMPPDQIRKLNTNFIHQVSKHWIDLLINEISEFPGVPIITLGEPVLNCLVNTAEWIQIRKYWGYEGPSIYSEKFRHIFPEENILGRMIFPFPHIHGISYNFYQVQMNKYLDYLKLSLDQKCLIQRK